MLDGLPVLVRIGRHDAKLHMAFAIPEDRGGLAVFGSARILCRPNNDKPITEITRWPHELSNCAACHKKRAQGAR